MLRTLRGAGPVEEGTSETPLARVRTGTELVAIYVTSSTCPASRDANLKPSLRSIRRQLANQAISEGKRLVWMGVALDQTPEEGIEFLKPYGPFDEILAGGSWLNTGSIDFLLRGKPGQLSTPQLIILERDIVAEKTTLSVTPDRLLMRKVGASSINAFAVDFDSESNHQP